MPLLDGLGVERRDDFVLLLQLISGIIPLVVLIGLNTRIYIAIKKRMQG